MEVMRNNVIPVDETLQKLGITTDLDAIKGILDQVLYISSDIDSVMREVRRAVYVDGLGGGVDAISSSARIFAERE